MYYLTLINFKLISKREFSPPFYFSISSVKKGKF